MVQHKKITNRLRTLFGQKFISTNQRHKQTIKETEKANEPTNRGTNKN